MRCVGLRYAAGWKRPPLNVLPHRIGFCVNKWIQPEWRGPCWCKVVSAILTLFHWGWSHSSPLSFLSSVNPILPEGRQTGNVESRLARERRHVWVSVDPEAGVVLCVWYEMFSKGLSCILVPDMGHWNGHSGRLLFLGDETLGVRPNTRKWVKLFWTPAFAHFVKTNVALVGKTGYY